MNNQEKIEFIKNAIKKLFDKDVSTLSETDNLLDLSLDSLDIVELQMYYEDETGYELPTDSTIVTVKDLMEIMK